MTFIIDNPRIGVPQVAAVSTSAQLPLGTIVTAHDPVYGAGEFQYVLFDAATAVGDVCLLTGDDGGPWAEPAAPNDKGAVGVALAVAAAGNYGWLQIAGQAAVQVASGFATTSGLAYLTATAGTLDDAVVAGDRVKNITPLSAIGTPSAGLALMLLNRPFVDDAAAA